MPTISVIVPVYKVEKYIHRCVDSILFQTFSDFELILVDDGSPDNCGAICDEYAAKDSRIRVIHQQNQGLSAVRNNAVKVASAEWILFVDSDDLIHPQMLEHMYTAMKNSNARICACSVAEGTDVAEDFFALVNNEYKTWNYSEEQIEHLYHQGKQKYWIACAKLVHKEILLKYPFTCGRIHEDNAVVFKWFHEAKTVAEMRNAYYFYWINPTGITKSAFSHKNLDLLWALGEQIAFYDSLGYERMKREAVAYYLKAGSWYLPKVCDILHDRTAAAKLRRNMRRFMKMYPPADLPLTEEERIHIHAVTPTLIRRILRRMQNTWNRK